jgi:AraC-like DNA-binding protein
MIAVNTIGRRLAMSYFETETQSTSRYPLWDRYAVTDCSREMGIDVVRVGQWILHHLEEEIDAKTIAVHFEISYETLRKRFERREHTSISKFIRRQRILRAAKMLENSGLRWFEIAAGLHLGRPNNASRAFARDIGISVRAYRRFVANRERARRSRGHVPGRHNSDQK